MDRIEQPILVTRTVMFPLPIVTRYTGSPLCMPQPVTEQVMTAFEPVSMTPPFSTTPQSAAPAPAILQPRYGSGPFPALPPNSRGPYFLLRAPGSQGP